jgi:hypothetical protein
MGLHRVAREKKGREAGWADSGISWVSAQGGLENRISLFNFQAFFLNLQTI